MIGSSGWVRELRGGRLLGMSVLVLGLLAVTAVASRAPLSTLGRTGGKASGGFQIETSPWEFALIGGGGLIAFSCYVISAGLSRRTPAAGSLGSVLRQIAVLLAPVIAALLIAAGLSGSHRTTSRMRAVGPHHPSRSIAPPHAAFTVPVWVSWGILGTVMAGVLVFVAGARPRRGDERTLPSAVDSAVTAALADLESIAHPRLAIIAAYQRMEQCLAEAGFPRAAPEAPREYLGRVASALQVDPKPLGVLTTSFEAAKFSLRQLDAAARERAITALHALQGQLA